MFTTSSYQQTCTIFGVLFFQNISQSTFQEVRTNQIAGRIETKTNPGPITFQWHKDKHLSYITDII